MQTKMPRTVEPQVAVADDLKELAVLWFEGWHNAHAAVMPAAIVVQRTLESFRARAPAILEGSRVLRANNRMAGFCTVSSGEITHLFVAKPDWGTGVADILLKEAEIRVAVGGFTQARLRCIVGNDRAAKFYEKRGWLKGEVLEYVPQAVTGNPIARAWLFTKDVA